MHPTARPQIHKGLIRRFTDSGRLLSLEWTTPEEPGDTQARAAVAAGADLVVAAGGDGTARMVATGVAGSDVPLGVIALGTANVLAGNLRLPRGASRQWDVACTGANRRLDLGRASFQLENGTWTSEAAFVVMAGIGHDAATVADTDATTKNRWGWLSYLWRGARRLTREPIPMLVNLDPIEPEGATSQVAVWSVLVGNCPKIPGGIQVFPRARPDDGLLDVLQARIKHPVQWVPVAVSGLGGRSVPGAGLVRHQVREVLVTPRHPTPVQLDGDPLPPVIRARFRVDPGAVMVRVPEPRRSRVELRSSGR